MVTEVYLQMDWNHSTLVDSGELHICYVQGPTQVHISDIFTH